MPHDKGGRVLAIGDVVHVPCRIKDLSAAGDYCNVTLETVEPMYPSEHTSAITLNARQVVLAETCDGRPIDAPPKLPSAA